MNELTVITTIQITEVYKNVPKCFALDKAEMSKTISEQLKNQFSADDVVVTNIQEFVREGVE